MTQALVLSLALTGIIGFAPGTMAQERAASGPLETQMTWTTLKGMIDAANVRVSGVEARMDQFVKCGNKGMLYAPSHAGKDADGCVAGSGTATSSVCAAAGGTVNGNNCVVGGVLYTWKVGHTKASLGEPGWQNWKAAYRVGQCPQYRVRPCTSATGLCVNASDDKSYTCGHTVGPYSFDLNDTTGF